MRNALINALREIIFNPDRSGSAEACFKVLSQDRRWGEVHANNWREMSNKDAQAALEILKREFP